MLAIIRMKLFIRVMIISILSISCSNEKFDSTSWKNDKTLREQLSNDLINSKILIGLDYNQVVEILGEPDINQLHYANNPDSNDYYIEYVIGRCPGIDFKRVYIKFNDKSVNTAQFHCD